MIFHQNSLYFCITNSQIWYWYKKKKYAWQNRICNSVGLKWRAETTTDETTLQPTGLQCIIFSQKISIFDPILVLASTLYAVWALIFFSEFELFVRRTYCSNVMCANICGKTCLYHKFLQSWHSRKQRAFEES